MSSISDDLSVSCTSMRFSGGDLQELSFAPTLTGCTGVHGLSVLSSIELGNFRSGGVPSVNSSFAFLLQLLEGKLLISMLLRGC